MAFEKAQLKKFFCLPGQMRKPRSSSLWSWPFWEAVGKCEVILRCEKSVLKGLQDRENAKSPIISVKRPLSCLSSNRRLREVRPLSGSPKFKLFKGCLSFRFFSFPVKRGTAHKQTFSAENQQKRENKQSSPKFDAHEVAHRRSREAA